MPQLSPPAIALIVVDVQLGLDDAAYWGRRNNSDCEDNITTLIDAWRASSQPIVFVRHDSTDPGSPLRPGSPGNAFKSCLTGEPDLLVAKSVNSAFYGEPNLGEWLTRRVINDVAICGITTNHCCETTARMAGNLGYRVFFVIDATYTFDRVAIDGSTIPADEILRVTGANLQGEFADVITTRQGVALLTESNETSVD
jgi:nicotinamidase-related amidase